MLDIFIPTLGRANKQRTLFHLPPEVRKRVTLVLDPNDEEANRGTYETVRRETGCTLGVVPKANAGIAWTREYIGKNLAGEKFLCLDDDLYFYHRIPGEFPKLAKNTHLDNRLMLKWVEESLDQYAHVGISMRQNNNNPQKEKQDAYENDRFVRALAYRRAEFIRCKHNRVRVMEDFDISMQLITKGLPSFVIYRYCQDQGQTQSAGGCSAYRTHEVHAEAVKKFHSLWPKWTKIVEKNNVTGGAFGKRLEIQIQWKRAFKESQARAA